MNKLYHIFKVYDYKGGELSYITNLTLPELASELAEGTCDEMYYDAKLQEYNREDINEIVTMELLEGDTYAGGDGMVVELFETADNGGIKTANYDVALEAVRAKVFEWAQARFKGEDDD